MLTSERAGTDTVGRYPPSVPQYARNRQCWPGGRPPGTPRDWGDSSPQTPLKPPANWGRTSMTAASGRTRSAAMRWPAAAPSTRKEDVASTERSRPSSPRRATMTSSASASVLASTDSSSAPAASLAAAQYWIVTLAIWDILLYTDPGAVAPGSSSVYTSSEVRPHQRARAVRRSAARPGALAAPGPRAACGRVCPGGSPARRRGADGRPARARAREEHLPPAADDGPGLPAFRHRDRRRPRRGQRRVGRR